MTNDELTKAVEGLTLQIKEMRAAIGDWNVRPDMAQRPPQLPGGEYNVFYRMRQIGLAIDGCVKLVNDYQTRLTAVEKSLKEREESDYEIRASIADLYRKVALSEPGAGTGTSDSDVTALRAEIVDLRARVAAAEAAVQAGVPDVITKDVVFKGRVGIGGLNAESRSSLQILGEGSILFGSNLDGSNWQSPAAHWAMLSLSGDGGIRLLQNGYFTIAERDAFDPDGKVWYKSYLKEFIDPNRPMVNFGPDSRGDLSLSKKMPPGYLGADHEYTQDVVLKIDEQNKEVRWELYRPGWRWGLGVDCKYGPALFWIPNGYYSRG